MKNILLLFFILPFSLLAQKVIFCESVDHSGNPKNASQEFSIGKDGGFFKILVKLNKEAGSKTITFDLYKLENGKEVFDNSLKMEIKPAQSWFYKEITFHKEGDYHVYVYDERDKLLGVGKVKIKLR